MILPSLNLYKTEILSIYYYQSTEHFHPYPRAVVHIESNQIQIIMEFKLLFVLLVIQVAVTCFISQVSGSIIDVLVKNHNNDEFICKDKQYGNNRCDICCVENSRRRASRQDIKPEDPCVCGPKKMKPRVKGGQKVLPFGEGSMEASWRPKVYRPKLYV